MKNVWLLLTTSLRRFRVRPKDLLTENLERFIHFLATMNRLFHAWNINSKLQGMFMKTSEIAQMVNQRLIKKISSGLEFESWLWRVFL